MTPDPAQAARAQHIETLKLLWLDAQEAVGWSDEYRARVNAALAVLEQAGASEVPPQDRTVEEAKDVDVQGIAAIAWRCIKECKDYEGPPTMCPAHQEEAKALITAVSQDREQEIARLKVLVGKVGLQLDEATATLRALRAGGIDVKQ